MKQTKLSYVRMLLIAVLALLMAFALVACNGDKKNNNNENNSDNSDNVEMSDEMKQLVEESRADIDAMFNYSLTRSETITAEEEELHFSVQFADDNWDLNDGKYVSFSLGIGDSDIFYVGVKVCEREDYAKSVENSIIEYGGGEDVIRIGNKVIDNYTLYQQILGSPSPSSITKFTKEQVEFVESKIHRGIGTNELLNVTRVNIRNNETLGTVDWVNNRWYSNGYTLEGICQTETFDPLEDNFYDERFMSINYTDDSYVRNNEATGMTTFKLTKKPGWEISEMTDPFPTGRYATEYIYNSKELPSTIIIPTKIGDYDIDEANFGIYNMFLESIVIEKEINYVYLSGDIKQITIPMSDEAFVSMYDNTALETINFGGTTQQWEELYGRRAQDWVHVYVDYEDKYVDITFTVHCTNGDITYPKTNA